MKLDNLFVHERFQMKGLIISHNLEALAKKNDKPVPLHVRVFYRLSVMFFHKQFVSHSEYDEGYHSTCPLLP